MREGESGLNGAKEGGKSDVILLLTTSKRVEKPWGKRRSCVSFESWHLGMDHLVFLFVSSG